MIAIVFVLVLILSTTVWLMIRTDVLTPGGPCGCETDAVTPDWGITITEPVEWDGRDMFLDKRVEVRMDGSLTIRDSNVTILIEDMFINFASIHIREGCALNIIGSNVTILPDIEIGSNNIIGAGAVVTRTIEGEGGLYLGVPAKKVKKKESDGVNG